MGRMGRWGGARHALLHCTKAAPSSACAPVWNRYGNRFPSGAHILQAEGHPTHPWGSPSTRVAFKTRHLPTALKCVHPASRSTSPPGYVTGTFKLSS